MKFLLSLCGSSKGWGRFRKPGRRDKMGILFMFSCLMHVTPESRPSATTKSLNEGCGDVNFMLSTAYGRLQGGQRVSLMWIIWTEGWVKTLLFLLMS